MSQGGLSGRMKRDTCGAKTASPSFLVPPVGRLPVVVRLILGHLAEVEPLLRATCTHEIDATQSIDDVVAELVVIGSESSP
jgi:hypothetical protein